MTQSKNIGLILREYTEQIEKLVRADERAKLLNELLAASKAEIVTVQDRDLHGELHSTYDAVCWGDLEDIIGKLREVKP